MDNGRILIFDDDSEILELLKYNLEKEGYLVKTSTKSSQAPQIAKDFHPDLIILDIMMPDQDGIETCRQLRDHPQFYKTFILFLTARSEEYSEVAAFENGADDYIIKPIKPRALISRINVIFEKKINAKSLNKKIRVGELLINHRSYSIFLGDKEVQMAKKEFDLLSFLALNPKKVYSRDMLLATIWGSDSNVQPRTVDVHIRKIRDKIGGNFIATVKGVGYKFDKEV
ncbi:response regulator transcription factor [Fulvivirgaceae bacterium BMA10]|uniref:Response regulator transcription factor n=1 Tax=Splendidivirga corallicola TaxID=3051826 RepID=A0ABT8KVY9_9BACT|nr:response regulator transcription factor [Fulvivirgaceae bacterium BMA10]